MRSVNTTSLDLAEFSFSKSFDVLDLDKFEDQHAQPLPKSLHVLVVEDDDLDFKITRKTLLQLDSYQPIIDRASDIVEAQIAAQKTDYDIVLIDFCLGMDTGVPVINAFGGEASKAALILLTGMPGEDIQKIALKAGVVHCINKLHLSPVLLETSLRSALHTQGLKQELRKTIDQLREANEAKERFYASMGHDLKTPLNAILGYAELISHNSLELSLPARYQEFAARILSGGLHLLEVINNIILSNGEILDELTGDFEPADLGDMVSKATELLRLFADQKKITINIQAPANPVIVECKESLMTQALINLLSNAVKYTPENGQIDIRFGNNGLESFLSVKDSGIGMNQEQIELARRPYGRIQLPTHLAQEGTGLGLPIVDRIMSCHGGSAKIESCPGEGTCVTLLLKKRK
ncbi:ATP-binding protein [uncultured Cohaesibacter sp.]|uniref:ATP-binding response regulator n=1 Tax=uncultured Cohaesibacter sp. TaxID=1002546 RepID=UPI0029C6B7F0|nr:ATP-binding protein [uncultured Cohaesibacter sp.]